MKRHLTFIVALLSLNLSLFAQDGSTNQSKSGMIVDTRTKQERVDFLLRVGTAYLQNQEYAEAINAFERVLEVAPDHQQARYILSYVYIEGKKYKDAETLLIELTELYPEDFRVWNNLAWLYATADDPKFKNGQMAVKSAREAMTLAPNDHHVWSTLCEAYFINGDYEKACRASEHMTALALKAKDMTKKSVDEYNNQIRKCKRAYDAHKVLNKK